MTPDDSEGSGAAPPDSSGSPAGSPNPRPSRRKKPRRTEAAEIPLPGDLALEQARKATSELFGEGQIGNPILGSTIDPVQNRKDQEAEHKRSEAAKSAAARLDNERAERDHRLWQAKCLTVMGMIVIASILAACFFVLANSGDAELKGWAKTCLNIILTGFAAYLFNQRPGTDRPPRKT
jgi:hypothetical protein